MNIKQALGRGNRLSSPQQGKRVPVPVSWKQYVPEDPTFQQFDEAWEFIFGDRFSHSEVMGVSEDELNTNINVKTKNKATLHGGFGYHTEEPLLLNEEDLYYGGSGCPWAHDLEGVRYHKVDPRTGLPPQSDEDDSVGEGDGLKEAIAVETIRRYIINHTTGTRSLQPFLLGE